MKNNTLSVKKLTKNLILRNDNCTRCLKSSFLYGGSRHHQKLKIFNLSFSSVLKFLSCSFFSTLHCLHCFRRFSSLAIYIWVYVLYNIHLLLFLQVGFLLSECDRTLPLYAILNSICSQILHVRSIWNSFKIFTVSLSAEEIANGTLNLSYRNFRSCRSNRSASHDILIHSPTI